jgi:hypothetical protein
MRKTLLAITILTSSSCFAADAVLDVEGEIRIYGKTVIDRNGHLVGGNAQEVVNLRDYEKAVGTYNYTYEPSYSPYDEECQVSEVITETSVEYKETCTYERDETGYNIANEHYDPDFDWNSATVDEQNACNENQCYSETVYIKEETTVTYVSTNEHSSIATDVGEDSTWKFNSTQTGEDGVVLSAYSSSGYESLKIEDLNEAIDFYTIGTHVSQSQIVTVLDSSYKEIVGYKYLNTLPYRFTEKLNNITVNGKTYNSCLVYGSEEYYGGSSVRCEGEGWLNVDSISQGDSPASASRMSFSSTENTETVTRKGYDTVKELRKKKIEQLKKANK